MFRALGLLVFFFGEVFRDLEGFRVSGFLGPGFGVPEPELWI